MSPRVPLDLNPDQPKQMTFDGRLIPLDRVDCPGCAAIERGEMGPRHQPSPRCESGKHPHCTCDTCF
jgi:hypothetical protein